MSNPNKPNKVIWYEILGKDAGKLQAFFGGLFGWEYKAAKLFDYGMTDPEATGIGGGIGSLPGNPSWSTFYVAVENLEATIARAKELGGKELVGVTKLPDSSIAVIADPEGHPVGLVQQAA